MTIKTLKLAAASIVGLTLCLSASAPSGAQDEITIDAVQTQADQQYGAGAYVEAGARYEVVANRQEAPEWMRRSAAYNAARAYALAEGQSDTAFDWLERAVELSFIDTYSLEQDTDLDGLRYAPRWAETIDPKPHAFVALSNASENQVI